MKRPIIAMLALATAPFATTTAHAQTVPAAPWINSASIDGAEPPVGNPWHTTSQINIRWRNPQDATITSHQIRYGTGSPPTFNAWATAQVNIASDGDRISGTDRTLAGGFYAIEVRAVNANGNGPAARVWVRAPATPGGAINVPDTALRTSLFGSRSPNQQRASGTQAFILSMSNLGIVDLTGINWYINTPGLALADNMISDISPLLQYPDLGVPSHCENCRMPTQLPREYWGVPRDAMTGGLLSVDLRGNPLNAVSVNTHIPALRRAGVIVYYDGGAVDDDTPPPPPNDPPETTGTIDAASLETGQSVAFNGRDYFNDPDGYITGFSGSSSNPAVATVEVGDWDTLTLTAVAEGLAEVTLSATDSGGLSSSLSFMVTVGNPASLGGAGELSAFASAPEGGVVELNVSLAKPRDADVTLTWAIGIDDDPATADADASDHGGAGGDVVIPAGETAAEISIAIADDADIEPAREVFVVSLTPQDGLALGVATATVHVEEGVCDRTPQVADELRGARDCAAVTSAELERRVSVRLTDASLAELRPLDFLGMAGMTILQLDGNGLSELPSGLLSGSPGLRVLHLRGNRFEALPARALRLPALVELDLGGNLLRELPAAPFGNSPELSYLYLDGNQIGTLPADLIAGLRHLRVLKLRDNAIDTLPDGFFAGVGKLYQLGLHDNPGAPFALDVGLEANDAAEDAGAEGAASVRLSVPQGAPFDMAVPLTVEGGTLAAETATIAAGQTAGTAVEVRQGEEGGAVTVSIDAAPMLPPARCGFWDEDPCFQGIQVRLGEPLTLFDEPAGASASVPTLRR